MVFKKAASMFQVQEEGMQKDTPTPSLTADTWKGPQTCLHPIGQDHTELQGRLGNAVSLLGSPVATKHDGL